MGVEDVLAMTAGIKTSMADFRGKFDAWSGAEVERLESLKQSQDLAMRDCEHKLTSLMNQKQVLEAEVGRVEQDGQVARHEVQTMQAELDTLRAKSSAKPAEVQERRRVLETESAQLEQAKLKCAKMEQEQAAELSQFAKAVAFYSGRLGLELENNGGSFSMVFTAVNPAVPEAQHTLCMSVSDDHSSSYIMDSCVPSLPTLNELAAELNETNEFGCFVRNVRAAFRALYP
jgi:chromosome segregation ATPase